MARAPVAPPGREDARVGASEPRTALVRDLASAQRVPADARRQPDERNGGELGTMMPPRAATVGTVMRAATAAATMMALLVACPATLAGQDTTTPSSGPLPPLTWEDVAAGTLSTYPPLLIAELERAIAEGRLREARGAFDLDLFAKVGGTVDGYYEYTETQAGLEQFTGLWGSTVYGGYRLTTGETLPDYYRNRTFDDGELAFGLRIPLLKGGPIDPVRAGVEVAELELQAVTPAVARQRLDLIRGA